MVNNFILVGRIAELKDNGMVVTVPRPFKNEEGIYESDTFHAIIGEVMYNKVNDYCKTGDLVGLKGRLQTLDGNVVLMVEKVTFLSSRNTEEKY